MHKLQSLQDDDDDVNKMSAVHTMLQCIQENDTLATIPKRSTTIPYGIPFQLSAT